MTNIIVTQRVEMQTTYGERRDALDQAWYNFLAQCELFPIIAPNHLQTLRKLLETISFDGILLTGGNSLSAYGGDAPERDEAELMLLKYAIDHGIPVLGVCRGMQLIQHFFGVKLCRVDGHIASKQVITVNGDQTIRNSFHKTGAVDTVKNLIVWAKAQDGVVKAVIHELLPIVGIMWHPERNEEFLQEDMMIFRNLFTNNGRAGS